MELRRPDLSSCPELNRYWYSTAEWQRLCCWEDTSRVGCRKGRPGVEEIAQSITIATSVEVR